MNEKVNAPAKKPEAKIDNKAQTQKTELSQFISSPVEQVLFLQRNIGNQAVGRLLKSGAAATTKIQQMSKEEHLIQTQSAGIITVSPIVEDAIHVLPDHGQPLPDSFRMGADSSGSTRRGAKSTGGHRDRVRRPTVASGGGGSFYVSGLAVFGMARRCGQCGGLCAK
ncbi:MAG: hypothetical protein C3F06_11725 [Candidatus Methanoperedenaceae archaeon]|nr:MAG: hypothetical protein C3F06_11725 [Candidatus Methanoperedenaceae archaeon]